MANPHPLPSPATQFKPGQSGNPGGRPKGESFAAVLRELLEREHKRAPDWRSAIAAKAIELAARGDLDAMRWIADRTDGRVREEVRVSGDPDAPLIREVVIERSARGRDRGA